MNVVPLTEADLLEQQDWIIVIAQLPWEFAAEARIGMPDLRHHLRARKLVGLLALTCLGIETDGIIYVAGHTVALRLQSQTSHLLPASGSPRMLVALARLLHRWLRCRAAVLTAPVVPADGSPAAKAAMTVRRQLARIEALSHPTMGNISQLFHSWARKSVRTAL